MEADTLPSAGLHYGVPFEVYRLWPAVNVSTLKPLRDTPLHCKWEMDHPRHSDEMDVGSALHVSILEPARFNKDFYIAPEYNGTTKEGKEVARQCEVEAAGRTIIRKKRGEAVDADDVAGMAEAVWKFKAPRRLLEMPGQCEVSALWKDPETGLMCKARFDKLVIGKITIILEIKTCRSASRWQFGGQCAKLGYAAQASYYRWAVKVLTGQEASHVFLAIENKGPWAPKCWTLDDDSLQTGALAVRKWLNTYAQCAKSNTWPGYDDSIEVLSLPGWANKQTFEETE